MADNIVKDNSSWDKVDSFFLDAVKSGKIEEAKALLEDGADVNAQDKDGWTALMFSAKSQDVEMAKFLMDNGADNEIRNKDGNKAIWIAKTGPVMGVIFKGLEDRINANKEKNKVQVRANEGITI